jgi:glucokinase
MYIAIDIGGTKTLVARAGSDGAVQTEQRFATNPDYAVFCEDLIREVKALGDDPIDGIGVAAPGTMDYQTNRVRAFGNLPWKDVDIKGVLTDAFNCPVHIDNDANLGAIAEARIGAGSAFNEVLYITISTGIGIGVTSGGSIDPALADSEGGMMHFRFKGELTIWERFASGSAFVERFGAQGKDVEDPTIWKEYAQDLSLGIGSLIAVIQPEVIVIGGSMGEHLPKYQDYLTEALEATKAPIISIPPIIGASDPHRAVLKGSILAAQGL